MELWLATFMNHSKKQKNKRGQQAGIQFNSSVCPCRAGVDIKEELQPPKTNKGMHAFPHCYKQGDLYHLWVLILFIVAFP